LRIRKILLLTSLILILSSISLKLACTSSSDDYQLNPEDLCPNGKLVKDEEISKYYGKTIDVETLIKLFEIFERKYPGHHYGVIFKLIEVDEKSIIDPRTKQPTNWVKLKKIMLIGFYDYSPRL